MSTQPAEVQSQGISVPGVSAYSEVVTMTPAWARDILEKSTFKNRDVRRRQVTMLAQAIRRGQWKLTHQGLLIDINTDDLVDGQHRLLAIIEADRDVEIILTYMENATDMFDHIDVGAKRNARDVVQQRGIPNAKNVAAGARIVAVWDARQLSAANIPFTNADVSSTILSDQDRWVLAGQLGASLASKWGMGYVGSALTAAAYLLLRDGTDDVLRVETWFEVLESGVYEADSPELALRTWFSRNYASFKAGQFRNQMVLYAVIRAWNARAEGRSMARVVVTSDKRPALRRT